MIKMIILPSSLSFHHYHHHHHYVDLRQAKSKNGTTTGNFVFFFFFFRRLQLLVALLLLLLLLIPSSSSGPTDDASSNENTNHHNSLLTSLRDLDELYSSRTPNNSTTTTTTITITRNGRDGNNLNNVKVISDSSSSVDGSNNSSSSLNSSSNSSNSNFATCRIDYGVGFTKLVDTKRGPIRINTDAFGRTFNIEGAVGIALAIQHLNTGNGSIISEVEGLNEICPIKFTFDVFDTMWIRSQATNEIINRTTTISTNNDESNTNLPCTFLGPMLSRIALSTSLITGMRGYLQMSYSSSTELNNKELYPLHTRINPSLSNHVNTLLKYLTSELNVWHLGSIHTDTRDSQSYSVALQQAINKDYPGGKFKLVSIDVPDDDLSPDILNEAMKKLKLTNFHYFFGGVKYLHLPKLFKSAYEHGIAGTGTSGQNHTWILPGGDGYFTNDIGGNDNDVGNSNGNGDNNGLVERNSPLAQIAPGIIIIKLTGFIEHSTFKKFNLAMNELGRSKTDMDYILSKLPTYPDDVFPRNQSIFKPIFDNPNFLQQNPFQYGQHPWTYDSTIAVGLAACNAVITKNKTNDGNDGGGSYYYLDGTSHFQALKNTRFNGVTGYNISFDPITGNRLNPQYKIQNIRISTKTKKNLNETHIGFDSITTSLYVNGQFEHLDDFIYNDGTTNIPSDLPFLIVNTNYLSPGLRGAGLGMCCIVILLSILSSIWTQIHSRSRVVRASQPIFLHLLSLGILIVGCAIIPLSFDEGSTTSQEGCDIACKSFPFLLSVGFSLTFAALWAKTHRVNLIIQNPSSFRRIQVTATDVGKPIVIVVGINVLILILWMIFAPLECTTEILDWDIHGRPSETRGYCSSSESSSSSLGFAVALCIFTLGPLILSVYEAYVARHISTEYAETDYILKALVLISVVCFIGIPVLIIAHDNPSAYYFVTSAILFVICISVLCLIFGPKIMAHYNWTILGRNGGGGNNNNSTSSSRRRKIPKRYSNCASTSTTTASPGSSYTDALGLMIMNHPNNNRSNESLEQDNTVLREDNEKLSRSLERLLRVRDNSDMLQEVFQQIQSEHPDLAGDKNQINSSMVVEAAGSITREDDSSTFNNMNVGGMMDTIMESEKTTTVIDVGSDTNSIERREQPIIVVVKKKEEEEENSSEEKEEDKTTKACNLNTPESN